MEPRAAPLPERGQVYRHRETQEIVVVRGWRTAERVAGESWEKIADRPHENGDYSYLCGFEFCRCSA